MDESVVTSCTGVLIANKGTQGLCVGVRKYAIRSMLVELRPVAVMGGEAVLEFL